MAAAYEQFAELQAGGRDPQRDAAGRHDHNAAPVGAPRSTAGGPSGTSGPASCGPAPGVLRRRARRAGGARRRISPQTRDMNPVFTGKDVSYIDTKQAQRAAETAVLDAERLATLAAACSAPVPGGGARQGVAAARLRRAPRRRHRHRVRPGVRRPARRLARRLGAGDRRARRRPRTAVHRGRRLGGRVEPAGAQPDRRRHHAPRRSLRRYRRQRPTGHGGTCSPNTTGTRSAGLPATSRRWAGGPTASSTATGRQAGNTWRATRSATSSTGYGSTRSAVGVSSLTVACHPDIPPASASAVLRYRRGLRGVVRAVVPDGGEDVGVRAVLAGGAP